MENGCSCHCPGVWLIQLRRADITGSSSSGFHVLGGLSCSFCTLRGGWCGSRLKDEALDLLPAMDPGPWTLLSSSASTLCTVTRVER